MGIMNEGTLKLLTGYFLRSSYGEGLPIHFDVVLRCKGGVGKITLFRSRKVVSGADIPDTKQSYRPDIPPCQGLKDLESLFWHGIRLQRRRGKEKLVRPRKVFSGAGFQAELRQAKTSQHKPRVASEAR